MRNYEIVMREKICIQYTDQIIKTCCIPPLQPTHQALNRGRDANQGHSKQCARHRVGTPRAPAWLSHVCTACTFIQKEVTAQKYEQRASHTTCQPTEQTRSASLCSVSLLIKDKTQKFPKTSDFLKFRQPVCRRKV